VRLEVVNPLMIEFLCKKADSPREQQVGAVLNLPSGSQNGFLAVTGGVIR
jgi:hypothetical protein